jgi:hypothetical protein
MVAVFRTSENINDKMDLFSRPVLEGIQVASAYAGSNFPTGLRVVGTTGLKDGVAI